MSAFSTKAHDVNEHRSGPVLPDERLLDILERIAKALEKIAPPAEKAADLTVSDAFLWRSDLKRLEQEVEILDAVAACRARELVGRIGPAAGLGGQRTTNDRCGECRRCRQDCESQAHVAESTASTLRRNRHA